MNELPLPREKDLEKDIRALLESGSPLVVLTTWEEDCVERVMRKVAQTMEKKLFIWSASRGFHSGIDDHSSVKATPDPHADLLKLRGAGGALALLKDFHHLFNDARSVRSLRDIALAAPDEAPQLVLVMPITEIPEELRKDTSFLDVPMPDGEELKIILQHALSATGKRLSGEDSERASVAAAGLTAAQAMRVFILAAANLPENPVAFLEKILGEKRSLARHALALEFLEPGVSFEHVGGLGLLKKWLTSRTSAFTSRARSYGLPMPRGLLLLGVQGCGKSLSAKSVAELWKLPLLRLDLSRIDPVSGEAMLMQALRTSEAVAPAVLWIDEIEKGFGKSDRLNAGVSLRALSAFVTWLQEKNNPVYVVATANSISRMPPELLRKGRFDEIFFVDLPTPKEREDILGIHLRKRNRDPNVFDLKLLAAESDGFSGAEIEAAVIAGMFDAFAENREVKTEDILYAIRTTIPLSTTMEEEIQGLRDWAHGRARPASLDTRLADLLKSPPSEE